jgi:hypothetical protein
MRVQLKSLVPGATYAVQARGQTTTGTFTDWSQVFRLTAASDTTPPAVPINLTLNVQGTSFVAAWNAVTDLDFDHYIVKFMAGGNSVQFLTKAINFEFTYLLNKGSFPTPQNSVVVAVASVDRSGNISAFSSGVGAINAAPGPVTNLVGTPLYDSLGATWTAPSDIDIDGYEFHVGSTSNFTPSSATLQSYGKAISYTYQTTLYGVDAYMAVVTVDTFGSKSTPVYAGPLRPKNATNVDITAPGVPTGLAATITTNTDQTTIATVSWNAVSASDLAGYVVNYRATGTTDWSAQVVDSSTTKTVIQNIRPYVNYDVEVRAYDFSANYSAWSSVVTTTTAAVNTAPAAPTGVVITGGLQTATVTWNDNTEADVKNGAGMYQVQLDTVNTFNSGNLKTIKTAATVTSFSNLTAGTTYYARVAAIDSLGLQGAYSSVANTASGNAYSDGIAPSSSPAPTVVSGIGNMFVYWTPVANADPVTYEVHISTSTGFTPGAGTKVAEVAATVTNLKTDASGAALAYGTTYFVKIVAKDRDGSAAASTQASGTPGKVTATDIASATIGTAQIGNTAITTALISDANIVTAKIADGAITSAKIVDANITTAKIGLLAVDTARIADLAVTNAKINDVTADKITANSTFTSNLNVKSTFTLGDATTDGVIQSFDYSGTTAGFKLAKSGLIINQGSIAAAALKIQNGASNLMPSQYAGFEFVPSFYNGMVASAPVTVMTSGAYLGSQYLSYRSTTAAATEVYLGTTNVDYNVNVEAGKTYIVSMYVKTGTVASQIGFRAKYNDGSYSAVYGLTSIPASGTWQRIWGTVTVPAGISSFVVAPFCNTPTVGAGIDVDSVQVEEQMGGITNPSTFNMPGLTRIDGAIIRTGQIQANATVTVNGTTQPAWSINMAGAAQFGSASIRGTMIVGASGDPDLGQSYIASGNFVSGSAGWKIDSSGNSEFNTGTFRGVLSIGHQSAITPPTVTSIQTSYSGLVWTGATGTYYYKITGTNTGGETLPSAEVSAAPANGSASSPTLFWNALPLGLTGVKIYRGTAAGAENVLVATITGSAAANWTDTGGAGTSATPPTVDSTANANQVVKVDTSGLYAGSTSFGSAPFSVDLGGNIIAPSGTITAYHYQSAKSGKRIDFGGSTSNEYIKWYSGFSGEVNPGYIRSWLQPSANAGQYVARIDIVGPDVSNGTSRSTAPTLTITGLDPASSNPQSNVLLQADSGTIGPMSWSTSAATPLTFTNIPTIGSKSIATGYVPGTYKTVTGNSGVYTTPTKSGGLTFTATLVAGRYYKVVLRGMVYAGTAGNTAIMYLYKDGVSVEQAQAYCGNTSAATVALDRIVSGSGGVSTFDFYVSGSGTGGGIAAGATYPTQVWLEDMGSY